MFVFSHGMCLHRQDRLMIRTFALARSPHSAEPPSGAVVGRLRELAVAPPLTVFRRLSTSPKGLTERDASARLARHGENVVDAPAPSSVVRRAVAAVRSPFVALLSVLGVVLGGLGEARGAVTIAVMVTLSVAVRLWQHARSERAVRALRDRVSVTVTVRRRPEHGYPPIEREAPSRDVVPGDVVLLGPGDRVPADVRVVTATDLALDQAALSGEALPVLKWRSPTGTGRGRRALVDDPVLCFAGTSVVAGTATGVVIATGADTYAGSIAAASADARPESSFDQGVRTVGATLIRFMLVMVPIVLAVNGAVSGDWARALMFAVAVAVGLTPEMLPVIVTTNLARGAVRLARRQVIVKRLNAIQDLGAIEVLCVDKTGTLTEDRVVFAHGIDPEGRPDRQAAEHAYPALPFQAGPRDRLDEAIAARLGEVDGPGGEAEELLTEALYERVDELAFDPYRRRGSVVLREPAGGHVLICKGDPDVVLPRCTHARALGASPELTTADRARITDMVRAHAQHGMRILAVATKRAPARPGRYGEGDETGLELLGFVGFVDPVRDSAASAVRTLAEHGVVVKILTGDNEQVAGHVSAQVGVCPDEIVTGQRIDGADDAALRRLVERGTVFARLTPAHKARIVTALRDAGHAVGFAGDGVNDAPALRTADVGIAADTATDVAKDAADLILLDKDLGVIARGIVEGRRTLGNTLKYVHVTASSNFGNVCTVLAASVFLPFLPMLPIQLLTQNLLYDAAQLALPWDRVDPDYARRPRRWDAAGLTRFMLVFGPLSSLFDLATFAVLWWVFDAEAHPELFHTGWFVEGLASQLLVVLILRSAHPPWRATRPGRPVLIAAGTAAALGLLLPLSFLAGPLGLHPPPGMYLLWLAGVLAGYAMAAQLTKQLYLRRRPAWW
jgi:P-type Mg2+ transporter